MFENEQRKGKAVIASSKITAEEENIVRQNVNTNFFDVEAFIDYLNTHEDIGLEIFENTLKDKRVSWTYLRLLEPTDRSVFIKRLPIYFYDLEADASEPSMSVFFKGYMRYKEDVPEIHLEFLEMEAGVENEDEDRFQFSYEPLYKMIDEVVFDYKIPIHKVLEYLDKQCGDVNEFFVFDVWLKYIKIVENLSEDNVFPKNILYAYNTELVKRGEKPIIYYPAVDPTGDPVIFRKNGSILIGGYFPKDENGDLVKEWIGIWAENIVPLTESEIKAAELRKQALENRGGHQSPELKTTIRLKTGADTRVFIAQEEVVGEDAFGQDEIVQYWKQEYVGPKVMKFDFSYIAKRREKLGMTIKDVSEATDINMRTYQRIESCETAPDGLNLIRIMDILNIDSYAKFIKRDRIDDIGFEKYRSGMTLTDALSEQNN